MSIPATMKFAEVTKPGGPDAIKLGERATPKPRKGEVLVKVAAAGINRADTMQREGKYPQPRDTSDIMGLELAGEIVALGEGVTQFKIGDKVCALLAGGGYAEYCEVPAVQCLPVPRGLSMIEAGATPETFFTVWTNVFERCHLAPGETLLIHGGSSGIGTTAIQLAKALGSNVYVTAGSDEKCAACVKIGADAAINYKTQDFAEEIKKLTGGKGVDVILDMVGADYFARNCQSLGMEGRLVYIATQSGVKTELDIRPIMQKHLFITGSRLRARTIEQKGALTKEMYRQVWPLIEAGKAKPIIYKTFPLAQANEAHRLMESSAHIGKIVLTMG